MALRSGTTPKANLAFKVPSWIAKSSKIFDHVLWFLSRMSGCQGTRIDWTTCYFFTLSPLDCWSSSVIFCGGHILWYGGLPSGRPAGRLVGCWAKRSAEGGDHFSFLFCSFLRHCPKSHSLLKEGLSRSLFVFHSTAIWRECRNQDSPNI